MVDKVIFDEVHYINDPDQRKSLGRVYYIDANIISLWYAISHCRQS